MIPRSTRRRILGAAAAAVLSLSLAAPQVAADDRVGLIIVKGTVLPTLAFSFSVVPAVQDETEDPIPHLLPSEEAGPHVFVGSVSPEGSDTESADGAVGANGACYVGMYEFYFDVKSNLEYDGEVRAATVVDGEFPHTAGFTVDDLTWINPGDPNRPAEYGDCAAGNPINGDWHDGGPTAGDAFRETYALNVDWEDKPGNINIEVTYSVAQFGIIVVG